MNCDEAFDLMTHPTDHQCEELLWHLQLCPRCQQMKETLAPALESFQQIVDDPAGLDEFDKFHAELPQSADQDLKSAFAKAGQPFLSADTVRMAEQAATRLRAEAGLSPVTQPSPKKRNQKRLLQAALVLVAGFLLGWGMSLESPEKQSLPVVGNSPNQQACRWISQREHVSSLVSEQSKQDNAAVQAIVLSCVACHLQASAE